MLSHRAAKLNAARNGLRNYIQVRGTNANTCVLTIEVGTWHTFARHDDRYDDRAQGSLCVLRVRPCVLAQREGGPLLTALAALLARTSS